MIKRLLLDELKSHLKKRELSLIIGPRQSGKTTLMLLLEDFLLKNGERTVFLNMDVESDRIHFSTQEKLINKIKLELGGRGGFVFIDEIQRKENAGLFLKGIYDIGLPHKFIVSGSGSLELKEKIHESLVGRKRIFELTTVSFKEFVNYRTDYKYEDNLYDFFRVENKKVDEMLNEYLHFGGYPRVVIAESIDEKKKEIDEIYRSYIEKDISFLLNIQKTEKVSLLIKLLASQTGNILNYSEVSNTLGLSTETVKKYLWYLEKTFIVNRLNPFYRNIRKEITKSPVYYFHDLGFKNYLLGLFRGFDEITFGGFLFQNFIYNILKGIYYESSSSINFWRTLDKAEVDFIVSSGTGLIPIEVKYRVLRSREIGRSLRSFIKKYSPAKAYIVSLNYTDKVKIGNTEVIFIPYYGLWDIK